MMEYSPPEISRIFRHDIQSILDTFTAVLDIRIALYTAGGEEVKVGSEKSWCSYCTRIRRELLEHRENKLGPWWSWMIRYVSPIVLLSLLFWEVKERTLGSYENYGRTVEFWGGWASLILIIIVATLFTMAKSREET